MEMSAVRNGNSIDVSFTQTDKSFKIIAIVDGKEISVDVVPNSTTATIKL